MYNVIESGVDIFLAACCVLDILLVFKRDLMMLQQNSYRNKRYVNWFNTSNESTNPWRLGACIALFLLLVHNLPHILAAAVAALIILWNFFAYLTRKYKKPLVFTARAKRIYVTMLVLGLALPVVFGICLKNLYIANELGILVIVVSPFFLLFSNVILHPIEKVNNNRFVNDARKILESNKHLKIIGITGSYGKTSTKHFLYHILQQKYQTQMTPGSYNTLLGVVRTIREQLKPYTRIFIVEMGAKQKGDVEEICRLVKPEIGIITSIGEQHLETFKTVDNILNTKFELVESLPPTGYAVINNSNPITNKKVINNVEAVCYGDDSKDRWKVSGLRYTNDGSEFTVTDGKDWSIEIETPLIGDANITNLLAAIIVARYLNVNDKQIRYACATMPQVEHRLQVIRANGGYTIIDDAFNSNPVGASMAADVIARIKTTGKRIVITPGMIELGALQFEKNSEFGEKIGNAADMVIIVGRYNKDAMLDGLSRSRIDKNKVYAVSSFADAQKLMLEHVRREDIVLYENDLPDTFK